LGENGFTVFGAISLICTSLGSTYGVEYLREVDLGGVKTERKIEEMLQE